MFADYVRWFGGSVVRVSGRMRRCSWRCMKLTRLTVIGSWNGEQLSEGTGKKKSRKGELATISFFERFQFKLKLGLRL